MLFRGSDDVFMVPHSRHTTVRREDVEKVPALKILSTSPEAGIYALSTESGRQIFITGHSEYDARTPGAGVPPGQGQGPAHRRAQELLP